jgi:hypothetical protein
VPAAAHAMVHVARRLMRHNQVLFNARPTAHMWCDTAQNGAKAVAWRFHIQQFAANSRQIEYARWWSITLIPDNSQQFCVCTGNWRDETIDVVDSAAAHSKEPMIPTSAEPRAPPQR